MAKTLRFLLLALALQSAVASPTWATEFLRIASWNMFNRPNDAVQEADLATIIDSMGTDKQVDILSMSETDTDSAPDTANVFNAVYGVDSYISVVSDFDGGRDRTGFVYNTNTVSLLGTTELSEGLTHNVLRADFRPAATFGEADFSMYSVHLKSGPNRSEQDIRSLEADVIRADADLLGPSAAIIYGGDFNWIGANEGSDPDNSAWDVFTAAGNGQAFDAYDVIGNSGAGNWRDELAFRNLHSLDPGESMDDRFDVQFVTDEFFDGNGLN